MNYKMWFLTVVVVVAPKLVWGLDDKAPVVFKDAAGTNVGDVKFVEDKGGVKMSLNLKNIKPGTYAMHIHEKGKCEGPKFESAGSHLNPNGKAHGTHNPKGPHLGDLPNFTIPVSGKLSQNVVVKNVTLKSGAVNSLNRADGSSLVIHAKPDDEVTDPSGNSGDRLYCAVIFDSSAAPHATP